MVDDEEAALAIDSDAPRLEKMCVGAEAIVGAVRESDSADGGHHPIGADGSDFANRVVGLVADVKIAILVEGYTGWKIELCLCVRAVGASEFSSCAGNGGDDPVGADGFHLADGVVGKIGDVNVCAWVNGEREGKIEKGIAVCAIGETKIGSLPCNGRNDPVGADMHHFAYDVSR